MFSQVLKSKVSRTSTNLKMYLGLGIPTMFLSTVVMQGALKGKNMIKLDNNTGTDIPQKASVVFNNIDKKDNSTIRNLVFQGGGPRGIAYVGALEGLKTQMGADFSKIERVAGTSSGAITASLLSVGYTPEKIKELLTKADFKKLVLTGNDTRDKVLIELGNSSTASSGLRMFGSALWAGIKAPIITASLINEIRTTKGVSSGDTFREWLDDAIADKIAEIEGGDKNKYKYLTFGELRQLQKRNPDKYKKLYIVGAVFDSKNEELGKPNIYSSDNTTMSNYIISDAVRISMSIPFVFVPHDLHYLSDKDKRERAKIETTTDIPGGIDGGVLKNYPIDIFDYNEYLSEPFFDQAPNTKIFNPETLGFMLIDKSTTDFKTWLRKVRGAIDNMDKRNLEPLQLNEKPEISRDIKIDTLNVTMFDFDLPGPSIANLQQSGSNAVKQYWNDGKKDALLAQQKKDAEHNDVTRNKLINEYVDNLKGNVSHYQVPDEYMPLKNIIENSQNSGKNRIEITGMSGTGKSQLALYAASQYMEANIRKMWKDGYGWQEKYDNQNMPVFWFINAESETSLIESLQKLAKHLGCEPIGDQLDVLYEDIFSKLKKKPSYLLILDNLEQRNLAKGCFERQHKHGLLIVTTQDENQAANKVSNCEYKSLNNGLNVDAATRLIEEICPRLKGDQSIPTLIEKFYRLPLALTTAAYYLNHNDNQGMSIETYLKEWDDNYQKLLEAQVEKMDELDITEKKHRTQETAILMYIKKLEEHATDNAKALLKLCSCLAPNFPKELLEDLLGVSKMELNNAVKELAKYSLINNVNIDALDKENRGHNRNKDSNKNKPNNNEEIGIHRLVQHVAREHYKAQGNLTDASYKKLLNDLHVLKEKDVVGEHDYYKKQYLLPHFEAVFNNMSVSIDGYSSDVMREYVDLGLLYKAVGAAQQAVEHYEKGLPWIEQHKNELINKDLAVDFYLGLGRAYQGGPGAYAKAKHCYEEAYRLHTDIKHTYTDESIYNAKLAETLNNLGMAYRDLGDEHPKKPGNQESQHLFDKALENLERSVSMAPNLEKYEMEVVRYKSNLGEVYRQLGRFADAEKIIQEAINLGRGRKERAVSGAYYNLGQVYLSIGENISKDSAKTVLAKEFYQKARDNFKKASDISGEIYENKHPVVARHVDSLGLSYRKLGDEDAACEKFKEASKILTFSRGVQKQLRVKIEQHVESCQKSNNNRPKM